MNRETPDRAWTYRHRRTVAVSITLAVALAVAIGSAFAPSPELHARETTRLENLIASGSIRLTPRTAGLANYNGSGFLGNYTGSGCGSGSAVGVIGSDGSVTCIATGTGTLTGSGSGLMFWTGPTAAGSYGGSGCGAGSAIGTLSGSGAATCIATGTGTVTSSGSAGYIAQLSTATNVANWTGSGCAGGSALQALSGSGVPTCIAVGGGSSGLWGGYIASAPTVASTGFTNTWCSGGGGTYTHGNAVGGINQSVDSTAGGGWFGLSRPAPTPPYTIKALIACSFGNGANNGQCGIGWSNNTNCLNGGALSQIIIEVPTATAAGFNPRIFNVTGGTGAAVQQNGNGPIFLSLTWFQLTDDGTTVTATWGTGPDNLVPFFSTAKAGGFLGSAGYTNIVIPFAAGTANPIAAELSAWSCTGTGC